MTNTFTDASYEGKIAGLLRKAESTDNEEEARLLSEKAEELMIRWGVDAATIAVLGTDRKPEQITTHWLHFTGWFAPAHLIAANQIVVGLGTLRALRARRAGHNADSLSIIGYESDVHRAVMLITSMQLQAQTALRTWWKNSNERVWMTRMEAVHAKRQFLVSFAVVVKNRLEARCAKIVDEAGTGTALALRDRRSAVDALIDLMGGSRPHKGTMKGSWYGADEGAEAGRRAQLDGSEVGNSGRQQLG